MVPRSTTIKNGQDQYGLKILRLLNNYDAVSISKFVIKMGPNEFNKLKTGNFFQKTRYSIQKVLL